MLYKKEGQLYSKTGALNSILLQLGSAVQPNYIDDDILKLYGFIADESTVPKETITVSQDDRKKALADVDWVNGANNLTGETKIAVEAWRQVVRDCPDCSVIPPLPQLVTVKPEVTAPLSETELDAIKNYMTNDSGWLLFLQTWKDLGFPDSKQIVGNLLIAYTKVKLNEIIGSI